MEKKKEIGRKSKREKVKIKERFNILLKGGKMKGV